MAIAISGSLVYDYIMNFPDTFRNHILPDQLHILSVSFVVDRLERGFGGTGGNIAYTIKLLGGQPLLVSAIGKDDEAYIEHFQTMHIPTDHIIRDPNMMTASAHITTDVDDNQITAFFPGPLKDAQSIDMGKLPANIVLISPTHKDAMVAHLNQAADSGKTVIFDPGQQITAFNGLELTKLISRSDYLIGNDYEMKLIEDRIGKSTKELMGSNTTLIVTLGGRGSLLTTPTGETLEIAPCAPKSVDDPTGAGDAYRAGLTVALEKGLPLKTCAQVGSLAATFAIEKYGTQAHNFTKEEFAARYTQCYGETIDL